MNVDDVADVRNWRIAFEEGAGAIEGLNVEARGRNQAPQGSTHREIIFDYYHRRFSLFCQLRRRFSLQGDGSSPSDNIKLHLRSIRLWSDREAATNMLYYSAGMAARVTKASDQGPIYLNTRGEEYQGHQPLGKTFGR